MTAIAVVVPVHDEEERVSSCLRAIRDACNALPPRVDVRCFVVLDACRDESEAIARRLIDPTLGEMAAIDAQNVGVARAHGAARAIEHYRAVPLDSLWIATTDADSIVPESWLTKQIELAEAGAEAIAGTVDVDDWSGIPPSRVRAYEQFYGSEDDAHPHVHGANLGVRADAYLAAGGFAGLPTGEDVALWDALGRTGRRRVSTKRIAVTTSSRLEGRAPDGFATFLRTWATQRDLSLEREG